MHDHFSFVNVSLNTKGSFENSYQSFLLQSREREREREGEREREREREGGRQRERQRQRDRETERERFYTQTLNMKATILP